MYNSSFEKILQEQASEFLKNNYLLVNGIEIYLKEIEVYYYEQGKFEDYTVHRNKLQQNRKNYFYVHRYGKDAASSYKSSPNNTRGGCDFVLSDKDGVYFSLLIRSIVINEELFVGPRKSLNAIIEKTGLSYEELEKAEVFVTPLVTTCNVLSTSRIRLGNSSDKPDGDNYRDAQLRFLLCDNNFKTVDKTKDVYEKRTEAIDNFLKEKIAKGEMSKAEAEEYSKNWLGYESNWLKELMIY